MILQLASGNKRSLYKIREWLWIYLHTNRILPELQEWLLLKGVSQPFVSRLSVYAYMYQALNLVSIFHITFAFHSALQVWRLLMPLLNDVSFLRLLIFLFPAVCSLSSFFFIFSFLFVRPFAFRELIPSIYAEKGDRIFSYVLTSPPSHFKVTFQQLCGICSRKDT